MRIEDFEIESNRRITSYYFIINLLSPSKLTEIQPGQFVQFRIDNDESTFLRRPISVYDVDYTNNIISLLIKEVGAGTRAIARLEKGTKVNIIYPLGNTFTQGTGNERSLLIGGGVGVAPLLLLAKKLKQKSLKFKILLGYQSVDHIIEKDRFSELGDVLITTDDGTYGYKGMVIDHPELYSDSYDRIYCCGPEPMMRAIAEIAYSKDKYCEVSLENTMACGYGVCLCCVVETVSGNVCTCTEGPVFNINDLKWQT